jgi:hypothetical protein
MMDGIAVRNVKQLPSQQKQSLEDLVGRQLQDDQQVFILAFTPGLAPSDEARAATMAGLKKTWEKVDQHMQTQGITPEEFEEVVNEAVEHVRRCQD